MTPSSACLSQPESQIHAGNPPFSLPTCNQRANTGESISFTSIGSSPSCVSPLPYLLLCCVLPHKSHSPCYQEDLSRPHLIVVPYLKSSKHISLPSASHTRTFITCPCLTVQSHYSHQNFHSKQIIQITLNPLDTWNMPSALLILWEWVRFSPYLCFAGSYYTLGSSSNSFNLYLYFNTLI